jgi:hypothetical protein
MSPAIMLSGELLLICGRTLKLTCLVPLLRLRMKHPIHPHRTQPLHLRNKSNQRQSKQRRRKPSKVAARSDLPCTNSNALFDIRSKNNTHGRLLWWRGLEKRKTDETTICIDTRRN